MKCLISTLLVLAFAVLGIFLLPQASHAANKNDFDPGYIVDDAVFYNSGAMTTAQVQRFLESKNPNCDYNGTQSAADWGYPGLTHAQLAEKLRKGQITISGVNGSKFHAPPYKCLTMYTQTTPQMEAASEYCNAINAGTRTAAQIIKDVADACGINPQVLIILLEKEQSLVTDKWPLNRQLQNATGFACPDTAPCNPAYGGFFYQVYYAARQFQVYKANPNGYNYRAGRNNNIYWHPDLTRCGSSTVYIQNQATAALYIYTPYRPNTAALNNLYGTGDSCSSYGNRNFWRIFTDWFGSTRVMFGDLQAPRWMQLKTDTYKKNPITGSDVDGVLPAKTHIFFTSKVEVDGKWYLRTAHDTGQGVWKGILLDSLEEVPLVSTSLLKPRWMETNVTTQKSDPATGSPNGTQLSAGVKVYFVSKINIGNTSYLQTSRDVEGGALTGVPIGDLAETSVEYVDLLQPRWMEAAKATSSLDLRSYSNTGTAIQPGQHLFYDKKVTINDTTFLTSGEPASGTYTGVPLDDLKEINAVYSTLKIPRWMIINTAAYKRNPVTNATIGDELPIGTRIYFPTKITIGDQVYLRTQYGTNHELNEAIPLSALSEDYVTLLQPRSMRLTVDTYKLNPTTGATSGALLPAGMTFFFSTKVDIYGKTYLRTLDDTNSRINLVIPLNVLTN